ncbi:hypothetical protein Scep_008573 [Stephania cephalantha]|uniref:U-box domain-containing protein n=1 Tax=Stephania cephalantha TaxID=152367 RepID=A0AAP0PR26_9MAGN
MARCHRSDVGSVVLDRHGGGGSFRSWSAFSGSAFRRMILDSMRCGVSRHRREGINIDSDVVESVEQKREISESKKKKKRNGGSEKLSELLSHSEASEPALEETELETKRKVEAFEEFQGVVKRLQCSGEESESKRRDAALAVRKLAKEDSEARETLAMLGAIPPLVGMLDEDDPDLQIASLYALLNLGIGNDMNKAAIVKAGAVHKMLKLIQSTNASVSEAVVANFLGLSALDANKPIIGSSGAVSFLVKILQNVDKSSSCQAKQDALRAIYNLSISSSNISNLLETDLVPFLMSTLGDMGVSDRILAILSNVVSTAEGRKAVSSSADAFNILVDVLNWTDSPSCQEKVSYILMVMAHKAYGDRQAMIEAGIVSSLLELTLLGSTLAQKRASRILECLRVDKGKQVSENYSVSLGTAVSAPICGGSSSSSVGGASRNLKLDEVDEEMMSEERKAVKQLVQQSLQNNMRRIVKRANLPQDFVPSEHFKSLTTTSTSKSLPF